MLTNAGKQSPMQAIPMLKCCYSQFGISEILDKFAHRYDEKTAYTHPFIAGRCARVSGGGLSAN